MKRPLRRLPLLTLVLGGAFAWWILRVPPLPVEISHRSILVDGDKRDYRLVVPNEWKSYVSSRRSSDTLHNPGEPRIPVVFALHGAIDTTDDMAAHTDLDTLCAKESFLLVYLQGRLLNWPPFIPAHNPDLMEPDLQFFRAMCELMQSEWLGDPNRTYVVGVSQGGAMTNVVTAKCSEYIAASVCNCGWLPDPLGETPLNTQYKCPMLFISGTKDQQVPASMVREGFDAFQRDGHAVVFHSIEGAGHGWGKQYGVNEVIWEFLSQHIRNDK